MPVAGLRTFPSRVRRMGFVRPAVHPHPHLLGRPKARHSHDPRRHHRTRSALNGSRPSRIVVFGINYWPEEIGIAPYTTGLAEHLAAAGWDTTVVTGLPHYPSWTVPAEFRGKHSSERRNGVEIVRNWHHVPARQTAIKRGSYEITYTLSGLRQLRIPRPDVAVGIVPSLGGGVLTALAARRWGIPSAVVVQDLMAN